jgi:hypothetical protein
MPKRKQCQQIPMPGGKRKEIHNFNGGKPFDWQRCHCKKYTLEELREKTRQKLIEQQGEAVGV